MTRQEAWQRATTAIRSASSRLRLRRAGRLLVGASALGLLVVAGEAAFRARIDQPSARVPTAIYTRPTQWGQQRSRLTPIAIGTLDEDLAEVRVPVALDGVPDHLIQAVLAVEDQRYYDHSGFDFRRIGGALLANVRARAISQGGSTLTQQLAKNLFLTADRTPIRKLREAAIASVLEQQYDKATILEAYLNEIYLGQDGGRALHGVGAAARYYFDKDVGRLSVSESALLAGMIHAPNRYAPSRHPKSARNRRNLVLRLMAAQGRISDRTAERAATTKVSTKAFPTRTLDARHFRDLAIGQGLGRLPSRGMGVYTTIDATLQRAAEAAVREGLRRIKAKDVQAAMVAIDPRTGEILAMVGGRDYGGSQFNRATEALRQPGSAFKPIVALAALTRDGRREPEFTLASVLEDEPLSVATPAGLWQPSNYDRSFRGEVSLREAIEASLNVPFARIGLAVGPERIVATARRLGITSRLAAVPSLALGSSEVTLLELVRAYGVFAAGGDLAAPRLIIGRSPLGKRPPEARPPQLTRVVAPAEAFLVTSALEGVVTRGTGRALNASGRLGPVAGKTGTSNDWRDAWFVAYTPSLVVGAWVGFDDGRSLRMTGATAALPMVASFLGSADADGTAFPMPEGIQIARAGEGESSWFFDCGREEFFLEGTAPEAHCPDRFEFPEPSEWRDGFRPERGRRIDREAGRLIEGWLERLRARIAEVARDEQRGRRIRARLRQ